MRKDQSRIHVDANASTYNHNSHSNSHGFFSHAVEHVATHAVAEGVGYALAGHAGATIAGAAAGLFHVGTLNEGEDRWVSEKIEREQAYQQSNSSPGSNFQKK